jgi:hypothetical protein
VAITKISWKDGGLDLHLLVGENSGPLKARLNFSRKVGAADETNHTGNAPPAGVTVTFKAEFKPAGTQPAGKRAGHGVEFTNSTATVEMKSLPTVPVLRNFFVRAEVSDADNSRVIRLRVHLHGSIRKIWLTPKTMVVHRNTGNQQFTVLAEFDDGTNGDITGRPDLSYKPSNASVIPSASGKLVHVNNGTAKITVTLGPLPAPTELIDTADVKLVPSLATERRIMRVGGLGPAEFKKKVNILFLPDGFTEGEKDHFNGLVDQTVKLLQENVFSYPYKTLKESINYWRLVDEDFIASEEENVSILSEATIVSRRTQQSRRLPFPQDPGASTHWEVEHLIFKVGLPVPSDANKDLVGKLAEWGAAYEDVDPAKIRNDDFLKWRALHTRQLLNERCTGLGFAIDDHPRTDLDSDRFLVSDNRRVNESQLLAMVGKLRTGFSLGVDVIGRTWVDGKDAGLVCVLARSSRGAGTQGTVFSSSLGRDNEHAIQAAPAPRRGIDLIKMELLKRGRLKSVHPMVPIRVAHECAHAFGLWDEYGGGHNHPAHRNTLIASKVNVQPESQIQHAAPATGIDGRKIRWNWPRLLAAGRLTAQPAPAGANFNVELQPGHRAQFAEGETVRLRKQDFVGMRPVDGFSGRFKIKTLPAAFPDRVVIEPLAGTAITPGDFVAGSALVKPKTAAAGGVDLPIIAPKVLAHIEDKDLPLNRKVAACAVAKDPTSEMSPNNLPTGLSTRRPANKSNIVGIYDGGDYFDCAVFHPAGICVMRTLERASERSARFCHVCRMIIDRVDPTKHKELDEIYEKFEYPEPP